MTSIEWLISRLSHNDILDHESLVNREYLYKLYKRLLEQAKEMHKKEIMTAYSDGLGNGQAVGEGFCTLGKVYDENEYYQETFKQN